MISHIMGDIKQSSYSVLCPEIYLCSISLFLLVYGVYRAKYASGFMVFLSMLAIALTACLELFMFHGKQVVMNGMYISDLFSVVGKCIILGSSLLVMLISIDWLKSEKERPFEFLILMLLSTLGMLLMVSANDFIAMYMALEMSSIALYVLASFSRDNVKSTEAGLKYFVLGALASGMMLFGISLVYGFAGSTNFDELAKLFSANDALPSKGVIVGLVLIIIGMCFKVSAVPFHMWAPDVYEGAPTPVTAFFSTAPKAAALFMFARLMMQPFGELVSQWQQVVIVISFASMVLGSLAGIMQVNIKRLLAYSSIGHVGFILMGLASANAAGIQAMLIYVPLYSVMSIGAFGCILMMRRNGEYVEEIKELSGLAQTHPLRAAIISVFMFSMAGIPPLAGFFGKMYALLAAVNAGLAWLAVLGVITSVISGYYYIKIVKIMYFDEPAKPFDAYSSYSLQAGIAISALVTLLFFLYPTPLVNEAKLAAESLLQ